MKIFKDILYKVVIEFVIGLIEIVIYKIDFDLRKIEENDVFVVICGIFFDGYDYIEKVI